MKKIMLAGLIALATLSAQCQQITGTSLYSPSAGGARILYGQGNTAANPAIGFHSTPQSGPAANPGNDGGGGCGFFRPLANEIGISTQSTERMRITSGGNIGINNSYPQAKLHITPAAGGKGIIVDNSSSFEFYGQGSSENTNIFSEGNLLLLAGVNKTLTLGAGGVDGRLNVNPNGNVAIGISTANAKLHVNGDILLNDRGQKVTFLNNAVYIERPIGTDGLMLCGSDIYIKSTLTPINMMSASTIQMNDIAGANTMTVNPQNKKVGIGTTTPQHKLHVHDGTIMVSGTNSMGGPMIVFSDDVNTNAYPNGRWGIEYEPNVHGLNFWKPWNPSTGGGQNFYMLLKDDGKIGMGIDPASCANAYGGNYRLYVKDGIQTEKLKVAVACSSNWGDYVFSPDYKLKSLEEVESYVNENNHLPGIPSAQDLVNEGLDVGKMQAMQMEKIEELTLYMIEMNKEIALLKNENASLKSNSSSSKN